jgi:hypothetical protein
VEPARRPPVVLGGRPSRRPGLDVVDLAVLGGDVAQLVEAFAVAHLDRPSRGPGEDPPAGADVAYAGVPPLPQSWARRTFMSVDYWGRLH